MREHIGDAGSAGHSAFAGALDDRAVGEGIAEGDAELNHVSTGIDCGERDVARDFELGSPAVK